ncbi:hypothetical protein BDW02DRAFT_642880 [Decorospora gaudefroyi]|uniref:DUF985 domain-containing protein n=1 Tax=Decorospora gaudefroyi TaxID=184978 RepID=A0A6A5JYV9_9PLEO|nr:hypothetical protein BDW02DRAFT_642880 [Decorospora gaudefroyi]
MSSTIPGAPSKLTPIYTPRHPSAEESPSTQSLIAALNLQPHIEGGYFAEIDRNPLVIPNPFLPQENEGDAGDDDDAVRNASTSIYYLLSRGAPQGCFHRNKGRTVHTVIEGRGRYVLIHADEEGEKKRVESFVVGRDFERGEKSVWVVEGGKFKGSYLIGGERLLVSETVVPGFEYADHDFLTRDGLERLVKEEQVEELEWLVRRS